MSKGVVRLCGVLAIFSVSVVAIPSSVVVSRVQAAPVTTGSCTAEVDNATGVTMTVASNGDCVLTFTRTGATAWTVPAAVTSVRALVVGGGGAGGIGSHVGAGGGGGAGAMVTHSAFSVSGSVAVVVGGGAAPTTSFARGANGSPLYLRHRQLDRHPRQPDLPHRPDRHAMLAGRQPELRNPGCFITGADRQLHFGEVLLQQRSGER